MVRGITEGQLMFYYNSIHTPSTQWNHNDINRQRRRAMHAVSTPAVPLVIAGDLNTRIEYDKRPPQGHITWSSGATYFQLHLRYQYAFICGSYGTLVVNIYVSNIRTGRPWHIGKKQPTTREKHPFSRSQTAFPGRSNFAKKASLFLDGY